MFSCGSVVPSPATLWYHISLHRAPHLCIVDHRYSRRWSVKHLVIAAHTLLRRRRQVGWDVRFHVSIRATWRNEMNAFLRFPQGRAPVSWIDSSRFIPSLRDLQRMIQFMGMNIGGRYIENIATFLREEKQEEQITFYRKSFPIYHISGWVQSILLLDLHSFVPAI